MENVLSRLTGRRYVFWLIVLAAIVLVALPQCVSSYMVFLLTEVLIYAIFALSLNLLMGYTGLPSLGHAAFFGMGGYTVALLMIKAGFQNFWLLMGAALIATAILGFIVGFIVLRSRGVYFLMITLAIGQMLWAIAYGWTDFTGGDQGLVGISRPDLGFPLSLWPETNFYYFVLIFFFLSILVLYLVAKSPYGRALVGIRENELRMKALGYPTLRYKYFCVVIAGLFGGLAGVLRVYHDGGVTPAYFNITLSGLVLIMILVGGQRVFVGPIIGAAVIWLLIQRVSSYTQYWGAVLGAILILILLLAPEGIAGYIAQKWEARKLGHLRS